MRERICAPHELIRGLVVALVCTACGYAQEVPSTPKADQPPAEREGINAPFLQQKMDIGTWLGRFEIESREVFAHREEILKACRLEKGFHVADIGAGTGFFSRLFAESVTNAGWVYAVDISPGFLQHITQKMSDENVTNMTAVQCRTDSVDLPPDSVDVVFVCDTYHHFEKFESTLASIHRALKSNGVLVIIDFERIPGQSREWILGHVRAGKTQVIDEIQASGFQLEAEVNVAGFKENYMLRFRKQ